MKKIFIANILWVFTLVFAGNFLFCLPGRAAIDLVKSKDFATVYYIDSHNVRHPFSNFAVYQSWYGADFSKVLTVGNDFLINYPLGKNITMRPGSLIKVRTSPKVYAVEQGGVLREIKNSGIATVIYGDGWQKRVVDVPDVFFGDYTVGSVIDDQEIVPDNALFKHPNSAIYYYKSNGILQPFASTKDVLANNLKLSDAIVSPFDFQTRLKPIVGLDKNVFNPTAQPITDNRDCENKKLKAAVIFVAAKDYTSEQAKKVEVIKKAIPGHYAWATSNLSQIDFDYPTITMLDDGYILEKNSDGTTDIKSEIVNQFFETNPDDFDFIFIWSNFKIPEENGNEIAHFTPVTNKMEGIGRPLIRNASIYGSQGKLKGVITMGDIDKYDIQTPAATNYALNIAVHEILHQWAAYANFTNVKGQLDSGLLRQDDRSHWSYYDAFISPLGGSGWTDNGNGTFTSGLSKLADSNLRQYNLLDLYLMGLVPAQFMPSVSYIVPDEPDAMGNTIYGKEQTVTIDQIIRANGPVQCSKL